MYIEDYSLITAEPMLEYENKIVGVFNKYKKGKAYLIGTSFCQSLLTENIDTENTILKILNDEGIVNSKNNGLLMFDLNVDGMEIKSVIIINSSKEKIHGSYEFTNDSELIDVYSSDIFNYEFKSRKLIFDLDREDAACIVYKDKS